MELLAHGYPLSLDPGSPTSIPLLTCTSPVIIGDVHVLFFTPAFPPFMGGGERYARSLALALAAHEIEITVITSHAQRESQLWQGTNEHAIDVQEDGPLTVIRCPLRPFPGGWRGLLLWRKAMVLLSMLPGDRSKLLNAMAHYVPPFDGLARALTLLHAEPTLVHGFNISWEHTLVAAYNHAQSRQLPLVITPFMHFGAGAHARVARNATMDHQRTMLNEARAVLALTTIERDNFSRWHIHPRRVAVVGGAVDPAPPVDDAAATVAGLGLTQPFALFLGRANRDKGAIHAAQATLALAQDGYSLSFIVAGQVTEEFRRYRQALSASEQTRVQTLGPVDEATKHALLQESSMLLLPSQAESFGIVILEAWEHATPVIGARAGGIPAVVDDEENGLLVPFDDVPALAAAMRRLLTDKALSCQLGRRGQEKVRREYGWDHVAERVRTVYDEALP